MDLRTHYPYSLLRNGLLQTFPCLKKDIRTEVAIIGAGITGAMVAWQLRQKGIDCVVVDKRHVATGSTAASTSLIQYEIDTPLYLLMDLVGAKNALRSYELCRDAITELRQICISLGREEIFEPKFSLQFASFNKHVPALEKEYELRKQYGFKLDLLSARDLKNQFHFSKPAALLTHEAGQADAYRLTHALLSSVHNDGGSVFDHTEVVSVREEKKDTLLKTSDGFTIKARQLVIACGYESSRYLSKKLEELCCTYAIISEPMTEKEVWKGNCLIWETAEPYLYLRAGDEGRVVIGGKDTAYFNIHKQLEVLPQKARALQKEFQKLFPGIKFKTDFQWAGAFGKTKDGLPYIGRLHPRSRKWFSLGFGGNGIVFSVLAARMISLGITGKNDPDMQIFSFNR